MKYLFRLVVVVLSCTLKMLWYLIVFILRGQNSSIVKKKLTEQNVFFLKLKICPVTWPKSTLESY